ncbi:MAG: ABC transporter permease, partial [bacterium]|nr:ABC transporter permease [bacterium]
MSWKRRIALGLLVAVFGLAMLADVVAPHSYEEQFREAPLAPPSSEFLLGTDDLGRDRLSRLIYGTRVSLLLAPAAALLTTMIAAVIGLMAGYFGGFWEWAGKAATDLFLSLPWLFLLLMVRAMLPLNTSPGVSLMITFALLGLLGWASGSRLVASVTRGLRNSEFLLQARAIGQPSWRLLLVQALPNLRPVLAARFWGGVPVFLLAEAILGILGLGVAEPLPSWGNLLRVLEGVW